MNTDLELERVETRTAGALGIVLVFGLALFTSAALLFWVQPLIAKMLLPLLGGAPSVWNTCMVFFQVLLLAGYAYSLLISQRLSLKNQAIVHAVLLLAAALVLPFGISTRLLSWLPTQSSPILWLLATLFVTAGPPFLLVSATAPLLQRWFSHTAHKSARDPYFLYAISNAGSMLALLAFPLLLEPAFAVRTQSVIWAVGYAGLVVFIIACALLLNRSRARDVETTVDEVVEPVGTIKRLEWTLLAFVPSSLMLGVTTYIATDVASVPLIWIIPLALYLLTFIIAFARTQILTPWIVSLALPFVLVTLGAFKIVNAPVSVWLTILLHLLLFFVAALVCHQRLAESRPHVSKLPEYYLWIAVGGALGGAFNALLAPLIFPYPFEYPIAIVLACMMRPPTTQERNSSKLVLFLFPLCIFVITFVLSLFVPGFGLSLKYEDGVVLLTPLLLCFVLGFQRPIAFGLGIAAVMLGGMIHLDAGNETLLTERNFFGVWRVTNNSSNDLRRLYHGSTIHGVQVIGQDRECVATSYYHRDGPIGQLFEVYNTNSPKLPVAITGLGSGTLATYSQPGQQFDIYDIDPASVRIASDPRLFTYLSNCTKGSYRVILGDARLKLREAPNGHYGLLVLDAFSSDSVPAHLLTTQALELYLAKLAPDGIVAFHISNRYLNLEPLLSGLSRRAGLSAFIRRDGGGIVPGKYSSLWVVMARNDAALGGIANDLTWEKLQGDVVWTDDFSNILSVLK